MKRGNSPAVRWLSLLVLLIVTFGGIRPAWSCPGQAAEPSCCCEPSERAPGGAQLVPVCCCETRPATEGASPTPTVAAPSPAQATLPAAIPVVTLLPPPPVEVESLRAVHRDVDELPPRTLLQLRTLFLC
jgi:hypothetical protein